MDHRPDGASSLAHLALLSVIRFADTTQAWIAERLEEARPPGDRAMEELERGFAIADVLGLAVFADNAVTESEWAALTDACRRIGRRGVEAEEAVAHWRRRGAEIQDESQLLAQVQSAAAVLDEVERVALFRHVERLSLSGAGIPSGESTYRDFRTVNPEALLDVFAEGLGVSRDPEGDHGQPAGGLPSKGAPG